MLFAVDAPHRRRNESLRVFDRKQDNEHTIEMVHRAIQIAPKGTGVKLIAEETDHTLSIQEIELILQRLVLRQKPTPQ